MKPGRFRAVQSGMKETEIDDRDLTPSDPTDPASLQHRQKFVPLAKGWIDAGISVGQMRDAVAKARSEAKEGIAYLPSYVDRVLASMSAGAAVVAAAQAGEPGFDFIGQ